MFWGLVSLARLGSAFPPFSVSPSGPFCPAGFPSCDSDGGAEKASRTKGSLWPAGPTLRETVEGLRGRSQLTAVLGEVLEINAPVFVMYGVFFSDPFFINDNIVTHTYQCSMCPTVS